jgi:hypothetical protein
VTKLQVHLILERRLEFFFAALEMYPISIKNTSFHFNARLGSVQEQTSLSKSDDNGDDGCPYYWVFQAAILRSLKELAAGRTCVFVAHRL